MCLFYFGTEIKAQTRYVSRRLRLIHPTVKVMVCQLSDESSGSTAEDLRADHITRDFNATVRAIEAQLDVVRAAKSRLGDKPFTGAGRGDDDLGRALEKAAEAMGVPIATISLLDDERHQDEADAYRLTELIVERGAKNLPTTPICRATVLSSTLACH